MADLRIYVLGKNLFSVVKRLGAVQENRIKTWTLDSYQSIDVCNPIFSSFTIS